MEELATTLYAKSMFEASKEDDCLKLVYEELNLVKESIDSNPRLMEVFKHPLLSNNDKKDIVKDIYEKNLSTLTMNFLYVLIDAKRFDMISSIIDEFNNLYDIDNNILNGTIITKNSLSDEEIKKYEEKLTASLKSHVKLKNVLDDSIIGGSIVKIGDKLIDSTLKGQLDELRKELINNSEVSI